MIQQNRKGMAYRTPGSRKIQILSSYSSAATKSTALLNMGNEASKPIPGTKFQVIGVGLPRSGTASFTAALEILLGAPLERCPLSHTYTQRSRQEDHSQDNQGTNGRLRGTTDTPGAHFVSELLELYPDAKVICTVRDPDAWAKSIDTLTDQTLK
ncbi:MAG: hypothetical protein MMC33_008916 [Icmadophila ericetorum]|nr:hypothetical protein [Icmadophila ericetorum]